MRAISMEDYAAFVRELFGVQPFPWQVDLAGALARGEFPSKIDVPTGLGKTQVVAMWAFVLGNQLAAGSRRTTPLRLMFVVDRRVIVDATARLVDQMRTKLVNPPGPVSEEVAAGLSSLTGSPLELTAMRGGLSWDAVWLRRPDQPAVVTGTVDQFGSRLLFRGYGTSRGLRPIDAALVSLDSWLVIDEAHLAGALVQTSNAVAAYQGLPPSGVFGHMRSLRVTAMSATTTEDDGAFVADLDHQVESDGLPQAAAVAAKRIDVAKYARLLELTRHKGSRKSWRGKVGAIGRDIADIAALHHADQGVTGVVCNTIATARAVHRRLISKKRNAVLLIGRCREFEKQRILADHLPGLIVGSPSRTKDLFVVATQTIEVGADLDFDVLVTEAAPLSALTQRFGRVNRVGERPARSSAIVYVPVSHDDDPVYGSATLETWQFLCEEAPTIEVEDVSAVPPEAATLDFGLRASRARLRAAADSPYNTEPELGFVPVAIGSHFERWAATSPAPLQDIEPGPFLRGVERAPTEVSVLWRVPPPGLEDADEHRKVSLWSAWLSLQPPRSSEMVEVPRRELQNLLSAGKPLPTGDVSILRSDQEDEDGLSPLNGSPGVIWLGDREPPDLLSEQTRIRPGDTVVLRSDVGGHDMWGWSGVFGEAVADVGDIAPSHEIDGSAGWRRVLRWDRRIYELLSAVEPDDDVHHLFPGWSQETDSEQPVNAPDVLRSVHRRVETITPASPTGASSRWEQLGSHDGAPRALLIELSEGMGSELFGSVSDESEDGTTLNLSDRTELPSIRSHGDSVGSLSRAFARNIGLSEEAVEAVGLAGEWHDLGKADPRFQAMLAGGDPAPWDEPLAKSGTDPRSEAARAAAVSAAVPRGFRHEAVSARIVDQLVASGLVDSGVDPDLLRHLVTAHHGHGRPLLPPLVDHKAPSVSVTVAGQSVTVGGAHFQVDWEQPTRFARLNRRYGWWGLAMLETIVRLADMKASEEGR